MPPTNVMIPCHGLLLEALVSEGREPDVVIVCHPHPLYGGSMDNNVVLTLHECLFREGWSTVRFNFRGVGNSTGSYGGGEAETDDLAAVAAYVLNGGARRLHLAGYSFGAWVVLNAMKRGLESVSTILASPPLDFMDFGTFALPPTPTLVVLGDSDSFCSVESLHSWLAVRSPAIIPPQTAILSGCDHFYWGFEDRLGQEVSAFVRDCLGQAAP